MSDIIWLECRENILHNYLFWPYRNVYFVLFLRSWPYKLMALMPNILVHPSMLWFYFRLPPRQHGWWWFPSACCPPPSSPPPARPPGPPAASPQRRRTARRRPAFATGPPTHCLDRAESSGSSVPPALGWRTARDDRCPRDGPPGGAPDTSFAKQT